MGQLKQTHRRLLCRMDVIKTLLTVLVSFFFFLLVSVAWPLFFGQQEYMLLRIMFNQLDLKEKPDILLSRQHKDTTLHRRTCIGLTK